MGGVESVLRHHHRTDRDEGIESRFVVYQENCDPPIERVSFLGVDERSTIRQARSKLKKAVEQAPPDVAVYHTVWGMTYWADLDAAHRRVLVLHSDFPGLEEQVRMRGSWIDGVLCVSEPLRRRVEKCLPNLSTDRIELLPYPIFPRGTAALRDAVRGRPLVIGVCGRLIFEQKRVDRLPALCAQLDRCGLDYRFEFLGGGPQRDWLESKLADRSKFTFHGWQSGEDYWRILNRWDAIVFVSDFEGTPISMLEAMSAGVIPIYPRIHSGGDAYAAQIRPDLLYEPDDFEHVASVLGGMRVLKADEVAVLRRRCQEAIQPHLGANYLSTFARFIRHIDSAPRIAIDTFPKRPWPVDELPLSWVARMGLARRAWLRWTRAARLK